MIDDRVWRQEGSSSSFDLFVANDTAFDLTIVSSRASLTLLAHPEYVGSRFASSVGTATREAVAALARYSPEAWTSGDQTTFVPLVLLRGGLSFAPSVALESADVPPGDIEFISSQRTRGVSGDRVSHAYKMFGEATEGVLVVADIVATGLSVVTAVEERIRRGFRCVGLIVLGFMTVTGVETIADRFSCDFPISFAAFEAVFGLPGERDLGRGETSSCDFLRRGMASSPGYTRLLMSAPALRVEACAVYDGGDRAFAPSRHQRTRSRYLSYLASLVPDDEREEERFRSGSPEELRQCSVLPV